MHFSYNFPQNRTVGAKLSLKDDASGRFGCFSLENAKIRDGTRPKTKKHEQEYFPVRVDPRPNCSSREPMEWFER